MVKGLLAINLWEEAVWIGFFQTRLERRHNIVVAALITAVPFSGAHLPLQFMGEISWGNVLSGFLVLCLAAVVFRLLLALTLRGARDSVLAVGVTHAMFNQVSQPGGILTTLSPGADPGLTAVTALVVALPILWWFARGKLSRAYRLDVLERDRAAALR
jgi:membrane protease YdiL (CAAX protease family)